MEKVFSKQNFPARLHPAPFLGLAFLSQTGMSFVQQGLVVLGSFFAVAFQLSTAQLGLITTALSLGIMVSMVFVGMLVDRLGPRIVLFWGTCLMAGLALSLSTVRSFGALLGVLFLIGIALAIVPSSGTKAVFTAFAGRPRGMVMGIRQTGVPTGAAVAAFTLPQLVPHWGLPKVYVLFALGLLVFGWLFSVVMPRWHRQRDRANHIPMERQHWRSLLRPASVAFFMVSGQYILLTYSITELHQIHHVSLAVAGTILALSQIGGGAGRIVFGRWSDKLGGKRAPMLAFTGITGALLSFTVGLAPAATPLWVLFVLWLLFGVAAVGWNALALTWAGESVPSTHSGFAMSLTGSVVFLGSSVFSPLFGVVVDLTHRLSFGWWMLSILLLIAATIALNSRKTSHNKCDTTTG
ncbi:MFS transporter [Alicyclobacillus sp. SO9]|uniref:MFS transporter n=1 Tax=Alicyclobacillus sp. SO9 TaxID=2665646 RepID=UPI0018E71DCF|nr:MFS transporter [Alicyclobacillus sp. SO9]QQE80585.1 MFS transporter [Alicyclobacillus sp. SO9]